MNERDGLARRFLRYGQTFVLTLSLAAGAAGLAAAADNSKNGPTGLLEIPTADVARPGEMGLSFQTNGRSSVAALRIGILNHVELGLANKLPGAADIMPHLKVQLAPEGGNNPGLAVGVEDSDFYVVASRQLPAPQYRVHLGLHTKRQLFFGMSAALNPVQVAQGGFRLPSTLLIGEWDGDGLNVGARFALTHDLTLDVGAGVGGGDGGTILGISYRTQL